MTFTDQQRAVIEALDISPDDLRGLAGALESGQRIVSVREVAEAHLALLPRHHRYSKSLDRLICWAGEDDAAAVSAADIAGWACRSGAEARADPKARHGVGAQKAIVDTAGVVVDEDLPRRREGGHRQISLDVAGGRVEAKGAGWTLGTR